MKKYLFIGLVAAFVVSSCTDMDDDINTDTIVQDFMWKAMNTYYFWQEDVPNLADTRFTSDDEYQAFLSASGNPEDFFNSQLRFSEDRFSFLSDDYKELVNNFAGVSRSNGLEFGLVNSASRGLFGIVRYIIPNSDAATKNIIRGEVFNGVDGQTLTLANYQDLLFGDNDTYTLNMADITSSTIASNGKNVSLTKQEGLSENPVFITKTIDVANKKVGYIMYNGFTNEYDEDLNNAFGELKANNVTDLVLDFRYNGGGSVNSARLLSSMIHSTDGSKLLFKQRWNSKIQATLTNEQLEDYFANRTGNGVAINTLNLSKVYILVTNGSASASELVINALRPYMEVVLIGTTTRGKNEFSITLVDDPNRRDRAYIYTPSREQNINPLNSWAIQPLVGRNENSVGFIDYTAGFTPDIFLSEDATNYSVLGDENEPLLARALQEITGVSGKRDFSVKVPTDVLTSSKMFSPLKDNMYLDKDINLNF